MEKENLKSKSTSKSKSKSNTSTGIYAISVITRTLVLPMTVVSSVPLDAIQDMVLHEITSQVEGRCIVQGYVKPGSCTIIRISAGTVKGSNVQFEVVFECRICTPSPGVRIHCMAVNITKAGIRAESADETPSPIDVFIIRDQHHVSEAFMNIQEGETFHAQVIGQRFELNDLRISVIAELVV